MFFKNKMLELIGKLIQSEIGRGALVSGLTFIISTIVKGLIRVGKLTRSRSWNTQKGIMYEMIGNGPELCLVALSLLLRLSLSSSYTKPAWWVLTLFALLVYCVTAGMTYYGYNPRRPMFTTFREGFMGIHVPNAIGFLMITLVFALSGGVQQ